MEVLPTKVKKEKLEHHLFLCKEFNIRNWLDRLWSTNEAKHQGNVEMKNIGKS